MDIELILILTVFLCTILESTLFALPLTLICSILLFLVDDSKKNLLVIFLACFLLDAWKSEAVGLSALFVFVTLFLIDAYKRSFEVRDIKMIGGILIGSAIFYSFTFEYNLLFVFFFIVVLFILLTVFAREQAFIP